jgi:hypothetical protein
MFQAFFGTLKFSFVGLFTELVIDICVLTVGVSPEGRDSIVVLWMLIPSSSRTHSQVATLAGII